MTRSPHPAVVIALTKYDASISQLVPLYIMNTLFTVLLGLLIFSEWATVSSPKLIVGSILIVIGGTLAASA